MNTTLGKDETVIKEATFSPNWVLYWLKAHYVLTNKRLTGQRPTTFLGVIPLGKANISQPLKTIASVSCVSKFWGQRLLSAVIFSVIGIGIMIDASVFAGFLLILVGIGFALTCFTAYFDVTNNAGGGLGCEVVITSRAEVEAFANEINQVISDL